MGLWISIALDSRIDAVHHQPISSRCGLFWFNKLTKPTIFILGSVYREKATSLMKKILCIFLMITGLSSIYAQASVFVIEGFINSVSHTVPAGHVIQITSEDGRWQVSIETDASGFFSSSFEMDSGENQIFLFETIYVCTGELKSEKVRSAPGTIASVYFDFCVLDNFPCKAFFETRFIDELTVHFKDVSFSLSATQWSWDFGDGIISDQHHPIH